MLLSCARVAVARLGRETFRELDPQYEVEARKRVEADVARAPVRSARLTDRKNERAEQAQKLCDRQKVLASDLRRHRVEKTMFAELDQARDKRLEKATRARTTAEASMEATSTDPTCALISTRAPAPPWPAPPLACPPRAVI